MVVLTFFAYVLMLREIGSVWGHAISLSTIRAVRRDLVMNNGAHFGGVRELNENIAQGLAICVKNFTTPN